MKISEFKKKYPDVYKHMKGDITKTRAKTAGFYGASGAVGGVLGSLAARKLREEYKKRKQRQA